MDGDPGANCLQAIDRCLVDLRHVSGRPAQVGDRNRVVHRLERAGDELVFEQRQAVLLEGPAALRHDGQRVDEVGGERIAEQRPAGGNSPIPDVRTMSSPKLLNALSTRWVVSGTSGFLSMLRKKMRTRTDTLPSSWSESSGS